jgi:hypothetical protein
MMMLDPSQLRSLARLRMIEKIGMGRRVITRYEMDKMEKRWSGLPG